MGIMQFNKGNTERAKEDVKKALGSLNTHLLTRTFLVGERVSLADISVCCTLLHLYQVRERERERGGVSLFPSVLGCVAFIQLQ